MSFDGRAVANFVLDFCDKQNRPVSNLALQKILYFCHVGFLMERNEPLVKHAFEAWEFGPVLQYIYREFKDFDRASITRRAKYLDPQSGEYLTAPYNFDDATTKLLSKLVDIYSRMSPSELVSLSHIKGSPWDQIWNHAGSTCPGMKISNEEITKFYKNEKTTGALQ